MLTPEDAWNRIAPHAGPLPARPIPREESEGRVLGSDLAATVDVPPADVSAMDGFAVAGNVTPGTELEVEGVIAAGDAPGSSLSPGKAMKIMTGAPVPNGADRVVPIEATTGDDTRIVVHGESQAEDHIRRRGEILNAGELVLAAGDVLRPAAVALLAAHGYEQVPVLRRPRVAFLTTGNEIVPPHEEPRPGQIRDTHTSFLRAALGRLGLPLETLGIASDEAGELRRALRPGLEADVLLVSGGVSAGEFDLVESALQDLGCQTLFHGVAMQPGKPLLAARHGRGLAFGLPGNPGSVQVCFWLLVRPVLRRMMGLADGFWQGARTAQLDGVLPGARDRDRFLPATTAVMEGVLHARPLSQKGSHDLRAFARATALIRVRPGSEPVADGGSVEILPID